MLKLKRKGLTDVDFMDPNSTFKDTLTRYDRWRPQVENNLFRFLDNQHEKTTVLFPFYFAYSMLTFFCELHTLC
jgi:hypothetical protein